MNPDPQKTATGEPTLKFVKQSPQKIYPVAGDRLTVHFTTFLPDGIKLDSSRDRNYPFAFNIGKGTAIKGWDQALLKVALGERVMLTCPPEYAYGKAGIPGIVPPDTTLLFDIELLRIG